MKAISIEQTNGEFSQIDMPLPTLTADQVMVKVKYSAIDTAVDAVLHAWTGYFLHAKTNPLVLGWHFSGIVERVGDNVTDTKAGDEVFGHLPYDPSNKQGSFAQYIVVSPEEVAVKPSAMGHDVAAALTTESLTALQALRDHAGLGRDSTKSSVLILGAGGGVGSVAIGIAKRLGAHVTALCSSKDVERVRALGADTVLNRNDVDFLKRDEKYDIIFDTPCAYSAVSCMSKLKSKGVYVTTLPSWSLVAGTFLGFFNGKSAKMVTVESKRQDLDRISSWISDGLKIEIDSVYDIGNIGTAMKRHQERSKVGRIVLKVDGGWQ